jgi:hypothetical protein
MRAENEQERAAQAAVRTAKAQQKELQQQTAADEFEAPRAVLLSVMQQDIDAAMADLSTLVTLSVGRLRDLLKYFFLPPTPNASKMKKDALRSYGEECLNQTAMVEA